MTPRTHARMGLGTAITEAEAADGTLRLAIYRDGKELDVATQLQKLGPYSVTWPFDGAKSRGLLSLFCDYLASAQDAEGGFGFRVPGAANGLILLSNPDPKYLESCRRLAYHCLRNRAGMGLPSEDNDWFRQRILFELLKELRTGARSAVPLVEQMVKDSNGNRERQGVLQDVLKAIGGKPQLRQRNGGS